MLNIGATLEVCGPAPSPAQGYACVCARCLDPSCFLCGHPKHLCTAICSWCTWACGECIHCYSLWIWIEGDCSHLSVLNAPTSVEYWLSIELAVYS